MIDVFNIRDLVDPRPVVKCRPGQDHVVMDRTVALLLAANLIFSHDNRLVQIATKTADDGSTENYPVRLKHIILRRLMSRVARYEKQDGRSERWKSIEPPSIVASYILAHHPCELPFPRYKPDAESGECS